MKNIKQIISIKTSVVNKWGGGPISFKVIGLGDDNRIYLWDPNEEVWVLFTNRK